MSKITGKVNYKSVLKGDTGYTYKPHVTTDGILYWTNNGNLENPLPVNIKGKDGDMVQVEEIKKINAKQSISLSDYMGETNEEKFYNLINDITENKINDCLKIEIQESLTIDKNITIKNWNNKIIIFNGLLSFKNCNGFDFIRLSNSELSINKIQNYSIPSYVDLTNIQSFAIKFSSCSYNKIKINTVSGFGDGIIIEGKDYNDNLLRGSFNNEISFKDLRKCKNGIVLKSDNSGWVNENIISDGSLDCINGLCVGNNQNESQTTTNFNNNKFLNIAFEQIRGGTAILMNQGRSNIVLNPRFEGGGNPKEQLIIKEGKGAVMNIYNTSNFLINLEQISLNTTGIAGSICYGDIRFNDNRCCNELIALEGKLCYKGLILSDDIRENTLISAYNDNYLFSYKDSKGNVRDICFFEEPIIITNENLLNNFQNFSNVIDSEYSNFSYYKTGNNEVSLMGVLKGGETGKPIYRLPLKYRPLSDTIIPIYAKDNIEGDVIRFVNITKSGNIIIMGDITNINRFYLDSVKFKSS